MWMGWFSGSLCFPAVICASLQFDRHEDAHEYLLAWLKFMDNNADVAREEHLLNSPDHNIIRRLFIGQTVTKGRHDVILFSHLPTQTTFLCVFLAAKCSVCHKASMVHEGWLNLSLDVSQSKSLQA